MRIKVTDEAVIILSTCHVPGCERDTSSAIPMEAFEGKAEAASGLEGKLFGVMMKGLRALSGREERVPEVLELPPTVCPFHAAGMAVLAGALDDRVSDALLASGDGLDLGPTRSDTFELADEGGGGDDAGAAGDEGGDGE